MNGCKYNTSSGCDKCPARQACEMPFEDGKSRLDDHDCAWNTDLAALIAIIMVIGSATMAALHIAGLIQ